MNDVIIIGAGISGLAARRHLIREGLSTLLLEKSRGAGGRMATRRIGQTIIDLGAQYASARQENWTQILRENKNQGVRAIYPDSQSLHPRYIHIDGMSRIAGLFLNKSREKEKEIHFQERVVRIQRGSHASSEWTITTNGGCIYNSRSILLTAPVPQGLELLEQSGLLLKECPSTQLLKKISYSPCIALAVILNRETNLPQAGILKHPSSEIEGIFDQKRKGVITAEPTLIIHATGQLSRELWDHSENEITSKLWSAALPFIPSTQPLQIVSSFLHRWKYCEPLTTPKLGESSPALFLEALFQSAHAPFFFSGDAFAQASIEGAFQSGESAAQSLSIRLKNQKL